MFQPLSALESLVQSGGPVLWCIFFAAVILWTLLIERFWYVKRIFPVHLSVLEKEWRERQDKKSWIAKQKKEMLISQAKLPLSSNLSLIRSLISICPLLGLLGTVYGMIEVFDIMAFWGSGNAQAMASGVSKATIPTMAGLVVALSGLLFFNRLETLLKIQSFLVLDALDDEAV